MSAPAALGDTAGAGSSGFTTGGATAAGGVGGSSASSGNPAVGGEAASAGGTSVGGSPKEKVALIVRTSTYASLRTEIDRYRSDVEARFPVALEILPAAYDTAEDVRSALRSTYQQSGLTGAVLVGALPYRKFHMQDLNIASPLYYEALDLQFTDANGDGIDDSRQNPKGGVSIWVANIRCGVAANDDNPDSLRKFFDKTHAYYLDPSFVESRALAITGSDWPGVAQDFADQYGSKLFGSVDVYMNEAASLGAIRTAFSQHTYGMFFFQVHSNQTVQGMSDGDLTSTEIASFERGALITINHGCEGCSWTLNADENTGPNTCMAYVCGAGPGQAVIGQTRTGMVYGHDRFYERLLAGDYVGSAYRALKQAGEDEMFDEYPDGSIVSGVVLIGNPFLSIKR